MQTGVHCCFSRNEPEDQQGWQLVQVQNRWGLTVCDAASATLCNGWPAAYDYSIRRLSRRPWPGRLMDGYRGCAERPWLYTVVLRPITVSSEEK